MPATILPSFTASMVLPAAKSGVENKKTTPAASGSANPEIVLVSAFSFIKLVEMEGIEPASERVLARSLQACPQLVLASELLCGGIIPKPVSLLFHCLRTKRAAGN